MNDATCKTCPWCQELFCQTDGLDGECHKRTPIIDGETASYMSMPIGSALWPMVTMNRDWCGSHPDRQPHLEGLSTTLVTAETDGPTAADMRRIVDALEKMATNAAKGCAR